jgi:hypothetical protein
VKYVPSSPPAPGCSLFRHNLPLLHGTLHHSVGIYAFLSLLGEVLHGEDVSALLESDIKKATKRLTAADEDRALEETRKVTIPLLHHCAAAVASYSRVCNTFAVYSLYVGVPTYT